MQYDSLRLRLTSLAKVSKSKQTWAAFLATQVFFLAAAASGANNQQARSAQSAQSEGVEACLACHADATDKIKFGNGATRSVRVDQKGWNESVHNGKLSCTDCHREITGYPHRPVKADDSRDYTLQRANTCQRCHYAHYTRVLDSIHYELLQSGMREAPTCVDCHGSHAIKNPKSPRKEINDRCGSCHSEVADSFKSSVHGKALSEDNQDVPVCTDCHGAHAVAGPAKEHFREDSYKSCATCHSDAEKMKKYDLNPDVLDTYLDDFHGASNRLYSMGAGTPGKPIASCTDCHGIHNIQSFKLPGAKKAAREQIVKTCQNCHEGVPPSFADAWMSHYRPTFENAPLVWGVKWFYRFVIPLIMLGLVLHILLHLWRLKIKGPRH
ncbi:MAG TPA: cytochrome C [Bdellovibrionales bacterium]|nr:MAG: hypothetical protein A2Z97_13125 [Bdellovibrionales bacterium GWB1_52_6]OFZ05774.1 MAG: hypothetical protein A2X97_03675 [Bdellovibrionales bacterium GWA1_52_35]OFZ43696.1 MAG: hypothetical protein A2070_02740 [Bdellovibrionales bacterium GWC1_52_8]HAR42189.1 cytochrome C [Bdellovibrionales bacterium]HCM40285.1 cytochrome C [Bdellovibrionales bacterium]